MLAGITVTITIVSALAVGILSGWAVLSGMLFFFGRGRRNRNHGAVAGHIVSPSAS